MCVLVVGIKKKWSRASMCMHTQAYSIHRPSSSSPNPRNEHRSKLGYFWVKATHVLAGADSAHGEAEHPHVPPISRTLHLIRSRYPEEGAFGELTLLIFLQFLMGKVLKVALIPACAYNGTPLSKILLATVLILVSAMLKGKYCRNAVAYSSAMPSA